MGKYSPCMDDWRERRKASHDEDEKTEGAILTALARGMEHDIPTQRAECTDLEGIWWSVMSSVGVNVVAARIHCTAYHRPIYPLQDGLAVEGHVNAGHDVTTSKSNDAHVVNTAP